MQLSYNANFELLKKKEKKNIFPLYIYFFFTVTK